MPEKNILVPLAMTNFCFQDLVVHHDHAMPRRLIHFLQGRLGGLGDGFQVLPDNGHCVARSCELLEPPSAAATAC